MLPNTNSQPAQQPPASETPASETPASVEPQSWDAWLEGQDDQVKTLYTKHTEGLLNTVKSVRSERDDFAKQIKALAKQQTEGSAAQQSLTEMAEKLEKTERRAAFLEDAMKPEVQCKNPRAAFLLAEAEGLFTKRGEPDWTAIRAAAPELFGAVNANANAGNGTKTAPKSTFDMDDYIRAKVNKK